MMARLVQGVGSNNREYPTKVNGKLTKEYHLWSDTLNRCYSPRCQQKQPTYIGCSVSENFKNYSYFYEWCQNQIGFGQENYHLDKDLLFKGNKYYSENTCVFLPRELNSLLILRKACRGNLPLGVSTHKGKFRVQCCTNKSSDHVGHFDTTEEAFQAYKQAKEEYIKTQAEQWKTFIDPRAYLALMSYEILITD